jgi:hypothetical protein
MIELHRMESRRERQGATQRCSRCHSGPIVLTICPTSGALTSEPSALTCWRTSGGFREAVSCYSPGPGSSIGTRNNWPVEPGRKPISRAASRGWPRLGVFVICRGRSRGKRWVAYLRTSWTRGFLPLQTFRGRSDRAFSSLDRLVSLLRDDFRYEGEISLFMPGDPGSNGSGFFCPRTVPP